MNARSYFTVSADPPRLTGLPLILAGVAIGIANFMVVLDVTIANVSINTIAGSLAVSPNQGTWVVTSYSVAEAITVPLSGWLVRRFGTVRLFLISILGFGLCSFLCGMSTSLGVLIALRVLQGLAGGPIMPLSQTLMLRIFPKDRSAMAIGLWSMTTLVGPIAGPLLGGILCDNWGWEWIFWINLPFTFGCLALGWALLRGHETPSGREPIDYVGLALLVTWVGSLQIMLDKGKDLEWFASTQIVALAVIAVIGFIAFLIWELTEARPIVDLSVFRHRGFVSAVLTISLTFGAFFSTVVLLPLWMQIDLGYTPTWAGRVMAFQGILAVILSPFVAQASTRMDGRILVFFGVLVLAGTALIRSTYTPDVTFWALVLPQLVAGLAMPFFFIPLTGIAMASVDEHQTASAAGLLNFLRTLAGALATSITTTAWEDYTSVHHSNLSGTLIDPQSAVSVMTGIGATADGALSLLDGLVQGQAATLAFNQVSALSAGVLVVAALAVWMAPRAARVVDTTGAH